MPQELRFSTLKENGAVFGNFFPPVDLDEFFPKELENDKGNGGKSFIPLDGFPNRSIDPFQQLLLKEEGGEVPSDIDEDFLIRSKKSVPVDIYKYESDGFLHRNGVFHSHNF